MKALLFRIAFRSIRVATLIKKVVLLGFERRSELRAKSELWEWANGGG